MKIEDKIRELVSFASGMGISIIKIEIPSDDLEKIVINNPMSQQYIITTNPPKISPWQYMGVEIVEKRSPDINIQLLQSLVAEKKAIENYLSDGK